MNETERRRRKFEQILSAYRMDEEFTRDRQKVLILRNERQPELIELRLDLERRGDLEAFRSGLHEWSLRPGYETFRGYGQMFVNQLTMAQHNPRVVEDPESLAKLLAWVLRAPSNDEDAASKIHELVVEVTEAKGSKSWPAPGRVPFLLSLFWAIEDHSAWPVLWNSAEEMLKMLGWMPSVNSPVERYASYCSVARDIGVDFNLLESVLFWLRAHPFVGLDPSLLDRCEENAASIESWFERKSYPTPLTAAKSEDNARAIIGELGLLGRAAKLELQSALGYELELPTVNKRISQETQSPFRSDGWTAFAIKSDDAVGGPNFRVWATQSGVAIGLHAGWSRTVLHDRIAQQIEPVLPAGLEFFRVDSHRSGNRLSPAGVSFPGSEVFVGKWLPGESGLDRTDLLEEVLYVARSLRPVLDLIVRGNMTEPPNESQIVLPDDELAESVRRFREEAPYPTEKAEWHKSQRAELATAFTPEALKAFDPAKLRLVASSPRYGRTGSQSVLMTTLRDLDEKDMDRLSETFYYLLWGEGAVAQRIDRVLEPNDLGFKGLGEAVVMKLLAISHPLKFIPVFPFTGQQGKAQLMSLVGLSPIEEQSTSRGELQVLANELLRSKLEPHFPEDSWGQAQFLYWLLSQKESPIGEVDLLGDLAKKLYIDRDFIEEIVALLREKGQVIFYGPPGTGKTFLARKLAAVLAPDPSRRTLVQFHPSTSYEDFFEGYRPSTDAQGQMTYDLRQGPLAIMAERASLVDVEHVIIIDEINRANLPRVFGELLFLLEYRDEAVKTLYRPEEEFELPSNLLVIGTMNTADRSIALVDAALRRRFHFIPFFPNEGAMKNLLPSWLADNGEPIWVADLVEMINEELRDRLGGPHLQLGPSFFMRKKMDDVALERIWKYSVFPFIEEQLFGQTDEIETYRFERVMERFHSINAPNSQTEASDEQTE